MTDWREKAACLDHDPELWFPPPGAVRDAQKFAKRVCGDCPVIDECAAAADNLKIQHGIWGGKNRTVRNTAGATKDWLQPCGTVGAYRRHHRNFEKPCDACLQANRVATDERRLKRYRESAERRANR